MKYLSGYEEKKAFEYITKATEVAIDATCRTSKCVSLIIQLDEIIGRGFNSLPRGIENQRRCFHLKDFYHKKVTDKTCCIHVE